MVILDVSEDQSDGLGAQVLDCEAGDGAVELWAESEIDLDLAKPSDGTGVSVGPLAAPAGKS